jgi:YVTN family beta-propeller protein
MMRSGERRRGVRCRSPAVEAELNDETEAEMKKASIGTAASVAALLAAGAALAAEVVAGPRPDGTAVTPQGWRLTPAGEQTPLGPGPLAIAASPDGEMLLVVNAGYKDHSLMVIDPRTGTVRDTLPARSAGTWGGGVQGHYLGLAFSPDGRRAYASDGPGGRIRTYDVERGTVVERQAVELFADAWPAGLVPSRDGKRLYVAGNWTNVLYVIDPAARRVIGNVPVGRRPYGVALDRSGARAFVTNWGADTVTVVDTDSLRVIATVEVGAHPSAILASPDRDEVYVAVTDADLVAVLDARDGTVRRTLDLRPGAPPGASPNALALSPDGATLFVANAGDNAVALVRLAAGDRSSDEVLGEIPTGWHPSALALDEPGQTLFAVNMKGLGPGPIAPPSDSGAGSLSDEEYIAAKLRGTLSRIPVPDAAALAAYTAQVRANNRPPPSRRLSPVIPSRPGDPTPIRYVVYVLKENRTYDQVLGDLEKGNGDPSMTIFPEPVTPNHHELARRFVTLDNFYCDGEVSADGWTWATAANANTYNQKNWPLDYGIYGRAYDFGGFGDAETAAFPGRDGLHAFLWDAVAKAGLSYRNYGFFVNGAPVKVDASFPGLVGHTNLDYPGWDLAATEQERVDVWLRDFRRFEASGEMPRLQLVYLPRDHTWGTASERPRPTAMVADNDLALGRIVEAISKSRFWGETAVFVVEDDAQDGPDHLDGHRTVAFAVSPYTQTGKVDSTFYSQVSMIRTMGLILGVPPLTQFDERASPMTASFAEVPNLRPYEARVPAVNLHARNGPAEPLGEVTARMDFSRPDAAPDRLLAEAIWKSVKGAEIEIPPLRRRGQVVDATGSVEGGR